MTLIIRSSWRKTPPSVQNGRWANYTYFWIWKNCESSQTVFIWISEVRMQFALDWMHYARYTNLTSLWDLPSLLWILLSKFLCNIRAWNPFITYCSICNTLNSKIYLYNLYVVCKGLTKKYPTTCFYFVLQLAFFRFIIRGPSKKYPTLMYNLK